MTSKYKNHYKKAEGTRIADNSTLFLNIYCDNAELDLYPLPTDACMCPGITFPPIFDTALVRDDHILHIRMYGPDAPDPARIARTFGSTLR